MCDTSGCCKEQDKKPNDLYTNIESAVSLLKEGVLLVEDTTKFVFAARDRGMQAIQNPFTLKEAVLLKYLEKTYMDQQLMYIEHAREALVQMLNHVQIVSECLQNLELRLLSTPIQTKVAAMEN